VKISVALTEDGATVRSATYLSALDHTKLSIVRGPYGLWPVRVHVIGATERDAPLGCEPLSWVLLKNLPIKGFAGATEKIQGYSRRWGIEIWHKVLRMQSFHLSTCPKILGHLSLRSRRR
jgi:hypothetical protein